MVVMVVVSTNYRILDQDNDLYLGRMKKNANREIFGMDLNFIEKIEIDVQNKARKIDSTRSKRKKPF